MNSQDTKDDIANSKWEFYDYVQSVIGVNAKEILAGMTGEHNKAYWDTAKYRAMVAYDKWINK